MSVGVKVVCECMNIDAMTMELGCMDYMNG
jgi:hypothetical protein